MHRLMLLRHAKAERVKPGKSDCERCLTKRGRANARAVATYMISYRLVPDQAFVSTATRAQETWMLLAKAFAEGPKVVSDERIYNATAEKLIEVISETKGALCLLVVGHNPSLHDLAVQLMAGGNAEAREMISEKFPTAGLIVIDLPIDDWSQLQPHPHAGSLERFVSPRPIAKASRP